MKKALSSSIRIFLVFLVLIVLTGCAGERTLPSSQTTTTSVGSSETTTETDLAQQLHHIYDLALSADAFEGTYEEWLASIQGPSGEDGREVRFQVASGFIQWQYFGDTDWTNLLALTSLYGPTGHTGDDGSDGLDGRPVTFQVSGNYIQWQYVGDAVWTNLITVNSLFGPQGDPGEDGLSAYEIYLIYHPDYAGDEEQWIHDLVNGVLREVITSTITFDSNGGSTVTPITQEEGTAVSSPADPTKEGFIFIGWFSDDALLVDYLFTTMPSDDMTLYASWQEVGLETFGFSLKVDDTYEVTGYNGVMQDLVVPSSYMGKSVTSIGERAFANSTTLKTITLPSSLISIGISAFNYANELTSITFESGSQLESIGDYAFYGASSLTNLFIPASVTSIGENQVFINLLALSAITVDPSNDYYASDDGVLFNKLKTRLIAYPAGKPDSEYSIPTGVTVISKHAFYLSTHLSIVIIPASVEYIEDFAFAYSLALSSITFEAGSHLETIGVQAFYEVTTLSSIIVPNGVVSIGDYAFYKNVNLTSFTIPSSVTRIGHGGFSYCTSLSVIYIPSSVLTMGREVFFDCPNLTIHIQAVEKPTGWDRDWNYSNCPVVWGYES